ncbi:hypothetical protein BBP40_010354 [Aspergillus hancockii]|nr:hypothetical protein BBP40_010354 [Aspergillus hancockii]
MLLESVIKVAPALYILYFCLSTIWYIYLHPLRRIPGPKSWIIFPILRHISAIRGRFDIDMRQIHTQYGAAVRFGPNEVSFTTPEAWKDIYGHGHAQLPKALTSASNSLDIISANDADHTRYRKALSHAFSAKGIQEQEPLLARYVDKLIHRLKGIAESQLPADMVKWYNLTTFDLIGDLAFGEPFGGLESSQYHHWVSTIFDSIKVIPFVRFKDMYPFILPVLAVLMPKGLMDARKRQTEHAKITVTKRIQNASVHSRGDFMDSMLRHSGKKDGLSIEELEANSSILIVAGSETTATLLSGVTYWLLRTPDVLTKVTDEVRSAMHTEAEITSHNVAARLPYMLACFEEAFRLYPPVPTGLQRVTLTSGQISGYDIAPGTKVSVHQSAAYWSPSNFHTPERFIPERWLPEAKRDPASPFFSDERDVLQPFSTGPRNCIGRNLAFAEMRVILARVLWNFDLELCEESREWRDQKSYTLWEKPPLMCKLTLRT